MGHFGFRTGNGAISLIFPKTINTRIAGAINLSNENNYENRKPMYDLKSREKLSVIIENRGELRIPTH